MSILSSSASSIITFILYNKFKKEGYNQNFSLSVMNSSLAGLAMISGVCDDVDVYSALIIGAFSGFCYLVAG